MLKGLDGYSLITWVYKNTVGYCTRKRPDTIFFFFLEHAYTVGSDTVI